MKRCVVAVDQGTTGTKAIVVDESGNLVFKTHREVKQLFPRPGWVEQDPLELWHSVESVLQKCFKEAELRELEIAALGLANQRETTVIWDRCSGMPLYNAVVWQCKRSSTICQRLRAEGLEESVHEKTGLVIDPYFSATKLMWLLDNVDGAQDKARRGDLAFGTVDSWLLWNLSGGKVHATDYSNASRTMMFNILKLKWDPELLIAMNIPDCILPDVEPSSHRYSFLEVPGAPKRKVPITGIVGDSQGALFGEACFHGGMAKATYGTGTSVMMNIGPHGLIPKGDLVTTVAWGVRGSVSYAFEGIINVTGGTIKWLKDSLGIIASPEETESIAKAVENTAGVYFVPAFVGLAAPYWEPTARAAIVGITGAADRRHIVRAALEAIAYQVKDVVDSMKESASVTFKTLRADGGASNNSFLMQFQADMLGVPVTCPMVSEVSALGAAFLAGLEEGIWADEEHIESLWRPRCVFDPKMRTDTRDALYQGWRTAVKMTLNR